MITVEVVLKKLLAKDLADIDDPGKEAGGPGRPCPPSRRSSGRRAG